MNTILLSKMGYARCNVQPNRDGKKILPQKNWKVPADINEGKTITFKFNYTWNDNTCNITNIQWTPTQFIDGEWTSVDSSNNPIAFSTPFFKATDKIEIKFGGTPETVSNVTLNGGSIADTSRSNISAAYLSASFTYSYTVKYENEEWVEVNNGDEPDEYSFIEYFIKIDNIRIPKTSKYENNVIFTEAAVEELIDNIKKYPVINVTGDAPTSNSQPYITVYHGSDTNNNGTKIKVGSVITFPASQDSDSTGTFRVSIDGTESVVPIKGFGSGSSGSINLGGALIPGADDSYDIGTLDVDSDTDGNQYRRWRNLYLTGDIGDSTSKIGTLYATYLGAASTPITNAYITNLVTPSGSTLTMSGPISISNTIDGIKYNNAANDQPENWVNGFDINNARTYIGDSDASISTSGGIYAAKNIYAARVFNAVFNDYAECRTTINLTPGHVVIDQDDGSLTCSSKRLQPGAQVISDTYGHLMGGTDKAKTPVAVAGRVLVYTYQPRENYHAGMAVCSAPDGTVDIMSRAEICEYPDCIVGIVSEIPQYETWGSDNVKVDGRIWIKVR